jgi:hypothetical protein
MALSFAGNGTITGLSVGGLPDGVVDEDCLANNAVGSGKLASGVGGKIIGIQQGVLRGTQSITTTEVDVTDGTTALELTSTNTSATKFLICADIWCGANSDVGLYFYLHRKIDGGSWAKLTNAHSTYGGSGNSTQNFMTTTGGYNNGWGSYTGSQMSQQYLDTPTFTTSVSYKIRAKGYSSTHYIGRMGNHNNAESWSHATVSTITLKEVAS